MEQSIYAQSTQPYVLSTACVVQVVPSSEIEREALAMENLLQAFSLDEPFSLELCGEHNQQRFLLRTGSEAALETLCQQILAQYPQAQLRRVPLTADPLAIAEDEHAIVGDFTLRASTWMPIKTFWGEEMTQEGTDPIVGILAAMEPVVPGERIACQIALVRTPDSWSQRYQRKALESPIDKERQAASANESPSKDTLWEEARGILAIGVALVAGMQGYLWYHNHAWGPLALLVLGAICAIALFTWWKLRQDDSLYDMKLVSEKLLRTAFYAQVRVLVIGKRSSSEKRLRKHLSRLEVAYRQYDLAGGNGFELKRVQHISTGDEEASRLCRPEYCLPYHRPFSRLLHGGWSNNILNAREVSGMWHLLQSQAEVPLVERLTTKKILAPPELFQRIQHEATAFPPVLAGYSIHRGYTVPIVLPEETLFSHKFVIAKSGYGKSTLMQLLLRGAMQPIQSPARLQPGVVAIDPHGDLIDDLLRQIPEDRVHDVVLIDLSDEEHPVGINLLDATMGFTSDQAVANAMASFSRIWRDSWGPRLAYVLKHTIKSLYLVNEQLVARGQKDQQFTLLDVNAMLQQPKYARKILAKLDKENIQHQKEMAWWNDYYFKLPPNLQQEVISPVSNKIGLFSDNHVLERIVGQPATTLNMTAAVHQGQIILVNLASGRLEFDAAAIIGATILNLVHRTLQLQATIPFPERRQVFIAVDEFQNIPGADYEALLSEDRKYGGSLMLATQSLIRLEQMKEGLEAMTFSNCAQLFVFATSAEDAEKLEKELHGEVTVPHILNQSRLNCYAKLALPDRPLQIFSMQLAKPEGWKRTKENQQQAEAIRAWNRERHPRAAEVDQWLTTQYKRFLEMSGQTPQAAQAPQATQATNTKSAGQTPQAAQASKTKQTPPAAQPGAAKQEGKKAPPSPAPAKPSVQPTKGQKPAPMPPAKQAAPHTAQPNTTNKQQENKKKPEDKKEMPPTPSPKAQDKPVQQANPKPAAPCQESAPIPQRPAAPISTSTPEQAQDAASTKTSDTGSEPILESASL